jgi:hypothetical protein
MCEKDTPSTKYARPGNTVVEDVVKKSVIRDANGVGRTIDTNQPIVH